MKKKIFLGFLSLAMCFCLFACGKSVETLVKENMSELTQVYYYGESDNFYCSISSGSREKNYLMDGRSGECVDFALLSLNLDQARAAKIVKVKVTVDGQTKEVEAEINSLNSAYLYDFEQKFSGAENISIEFEGKSVNLSNLSNDFQINSDKALEIASKNMKDKITLKKKFGNLNAEGYLRILDKKANSFDGIFWCYTVLNVNDESYSIIISTATGEVLAKS